MEQPMSQNEFPNGWDEEKVQQVLTHYEGQTEDEALAKDETMLAFEQVSALPADALEDIRWRLVQKSWDGPLPPNERLQLRLVEVRIDAEDRVQNAALLGEESRLEQRQEEILSSLEQLIAELRK
jgi:hypothetical protein